MTNRNSDAAQKAWEDEAASLGLSFPEANDPFMCISGCPSCLSRRNQVRAAREAKKLAHAAVPTLNFHTEDGTPIPGFYLQPSDDADERPFTTQELEKRFTHHRPDVDAQTKHDWVRELFLDFSGELNEYLRGLAGREASLAMTAMEEASFWAHAAIARKGK